MDLLFQTANMLAMPAPVECAAQGTTTFPLQTPALKQPQPLANAKPTKQPPLANTARQDII